MSDLQHKFTTFETQVNTQHVSLMGALTLISDQIAALTLAMGGTPPTASASLADVIAALNAQKAVLDDIHLDTQSIDLKALTIRDTVANIHLDTISQDQKLLVIRNTIVTIDATLATMDTRMIDIYASLGAGVGASLHTIAATMLDLAASCAAISIVLGSPADDTQSVLRWIEDIAACACADPLALPPLENCVEPFTSTGMVLSPFSFIGFEDVAAAIWSAPLPQGLEYGLIVGVSENYAVIKSDDWSGWRVYVQSTEGNYARTWTSADRYNTNVWQDLPAGAAEYSFAVRGQGSLKVTLCPSGPAAPICEDYVLGPSEVVRLGWHTTPTTIQVLTPSAGVVGLYFWRWTNEGVHEDSSLDGISDAAEYLDDGHIAIQNASMTNPVTVRVCCPYPGTSPHD